MFENLDDKDEFKSQEGVRLTCNGCKRRCFVSEIVRNESLVMKTVTHHCPNCGRHLTFLDYGWRTGHD